MLKCDLSKYSKFRPQTNHGHALPNRIVFTMRHYEKDFIDEIPKILSSRKRRVVKHLPFYHAAVLVPLFQKRGEFYLLLTKRSDHVRYHKGQISFPGGAAKEEDSSLEKAALREAFEEIGLHERDVQIIGLLDDVVTHTSEFIVTPHCWPHPISVSF